MNHRRVLEPFLRRGALLFCVGALAAAQPAAAQGNDDVRVIQPDPVQRAAPDSRRQLTIDKYNKAVEDYVAGRYQDAYQAANVLASGRNLDYLLRDVYYLRALAAFGGMKTIPLGKMSAVNAFRELRGVSKFTPILTLMEAEAFMENHEYGRAAYDFGQYLEANTSDQPNRRYARLYRAFAYEQDGTDESLATSIGLWDDILMRGDTSRVFNRSGILYLRGASHLRLAELKEALADLDESIRLDPNNAQAYRSRMTLYSYIGNDAAMQADVAKLIALGEKHDIPNTDPIIVRVNKAIYAGTATASDYGDRALMLLLGGNFLVAQRDAEQCLKRDPKNILGLLASALLMRPGDEKTLQAFNDIIARAPDQLLAYSGRGSAYEARNKYDLAAADFEKGYTLDRTYETTAKKYASFLVRQMSRRPKEDAAGRLADARRAVEVSPNLPEVNALNIKTLEEAVVLADANGRIAAGKGSGKDYYTRGRGFFNNREWDAAVADLLKARERDGTNNSVVELLARAFNNRGNSSFKAGKVEEALKDFEQAHELRPDDPIAAQNLEVAKAAIVSAADKAKEDVEFESLRLRALNKKNLTAEEYYRLGQIYEKRGQWDSAGYRYDDAAKRDKKNPLYPTMNGRMQLKNPDYIIIANEQFLRALKIDPHYRDANFFMGYLSVRNHDWDKAISYSSAAIETDPKMENAYFNRGYAYRQKRDFDKAIADYETILKLEPGNKEAMDKLAATRKEQGG